MMHRIFSAGPILPCDQGLSPGSPERTRVNRIEYGTSKWIMNGQPPQRRKCKVFLKIEFVTTTEPKQ